MTEPVVPSELLLPGVRLGLGGPAVDLRIADGRIVAIDPVGAERGNAAVIDAPGATVLPGMRDAHVHLSQWAAALQRVDLSQAVSAADAVAAMAAADAARPTVPGQVLSGYGFRDGLWPDVPHKDLLQQALPDVPAVMISQDLHCAVYSPAALRLIGLDHPTGLLREEECFAASAALPDADVEQQDRWALAAVQRAAALGVTRILDFEFTDTLATWRRRAALDGPLPLRVAAAVRPERLDAAIDAGFRTGDVVDGTAGLVTVGPCKVLMDGSLNTRTALCHQPYPGISNPDEARGLLTQDPDELVELMRHGTGNGYSFAVHAIGDRANTLALDAFAAAGIGGRIEHAQLVSPADLPRFAELGVIAGVQPGHAVEDRDVADTHWGGRTQNAFPYRGLLDAGAVLEFGSDAPVSRLDPWHAISAAVNRTDDDRPSWHPEQAIDVRDAVAASTGGRIRPAVGDVADLVIVEQDPLEVPTAELGDITVLATLLEGRPTYRAS